MTLMFRDPFTDTIPMRQALDRLFEESLPRPFRHWLAVDVYETASTLVIKAALPGVKPDEVDIAIDGDTLTIMGELKADETSVDRQYHRRELHVGSFERALRLPERFEASKTDALFENGILTLMIPKAEQAEVKHIKVQPVLVEAKAVEIER